MRFLRLLLKILLSAPGAEVRKMLAIAFGVYLIPRIGEWLIEKVHTLRFWIGNCRYN